VKDCVEGLSLKTVLVSLIDQATTGEHFWQYSVLLLTKS